MSTGQEIPGTPQGPDLPTQTLRHGDDVNSQQPTPPTHPPSVASRQPSIREPVPASDLPLRAAPELPAPRPLHSYVHEGGKEIKVEDPDCYEPS
ncbi:hypothetical protein AJ79_09369 [Helicocarpus griseus UAMH5409]|uniref:Uncharacterized protein n=1 Tax=Helicocarpus griseus UAMH5409 TaxID=1447875 RepID=A0A2B7WKE7_9EURO|nr:hypothetical protein AJ79_09369 [Helicocarpus griseus UAMH5409]